jgi:tRNA pseudouridine38-40 synthase
MDPNASSLRVTSRTDAGVHAEEQYIAFDTDSNIGLRGWLLGLTGHLPPEIAVLRASRVAPAYQPSKRAIRKVYRYLILQGTVRDPFLADRAWRVFETLDHELMRKEAETLIGEHDFRAFRGAADFREHTVRHITRVDIQTLQDKPRVLAIDVEGNRFMYRMVRIIVGTLVDIGRGKLLPGAVRRGLDTGDRLKLGMTAPAEGLYLRHIELAEVPNQNWPDHFTGELARPPTLGP